MKNRKNIVRKLKSYFKVLGPGFITGASDDDPSGIGTYSQTGAQFGYAQLWTALVTFPLMAAIQEICARIALQTGAGLAQSIRRNYPKSVLYLCVSLLVIANTINIGADLGAMAASAQLLLPVPFFLLLAGIALFTALMEILVEYKKYARYLRWLTLSLFSYVLVAFFVRQDWHSAFKHTFVPVIRFDHDYLLNLVAILGTTISPYLFFWQAGEEVEEEIVNGKTTESKRVGMSGKELRWMRADVISGMFFSNLVMWFIILTTGSTLFRHGIHVIDSAPKAAEALRPLAGDFAFVLFSTGIIGTGLLAIPTLAGSAAYAVAETFKFREGLYLKPRRARRFYAVIGLSTIAGAAMNLTGINPMTALYYTAVLNGVAAPPLLVMIMLVGNNSTIMRERKNGPMSNILGWFTTAVMAIAAVALLLSFHHPH